MQTDKFLIKVKLPNGIWKCDCTEITINSRIHYEVDITPPASYKTKKLYDSVDFNFQPPTSDFTFKRWQFEEDEFEEILEEELSGKIVKRHLG